MKRFAFLLAALSLPLTLASQGNGDWAGFGRYAQANAALQKAPSVVFLGDSITDFWQQADPEFFRDGNFACRGISGQVTGQMLCRFRADVIDLHPRAVVILAGTNDIACNEGCVPLERIADNVVSMAELARANGIEPILCSILPAKTYWWRPDLDNAPAKIGAVNDRLRAYAAANGLQWVDYYTPLAAADGSLRPEYTDDGVHPTPAGYDAMRRIVAPIVENYSGN